MTLLHALHVQWPNSMGYPNGVSSIGEYEDYLYKIRGLGEVVYRGEAEFFDTFATPSLFRKGDLFPSKAGHNLTKAEYAQIRLCQLKRPHYLFRFGLNRPEWVGLAQHYHFKTRLLDVSQDSKIGLFFACWSLDEPPVKSDEDGWVYVLAKGNLRPMTVARKEAYSRDIEQGISSSFLDLFDPSEASPLHKDIGHLYTPKTDRLMNQRMNAQRGAFIWWHPPWNKFPAQIVPVKIAGGAKQAILDDLDKMGISIEVMFPDRFGRGQLRKSRAGDA